MKRALLLVVFAVFVTAGASAQSTEFIFNPDRTGELSDPLPVYGHNGVRGMSGPWDLDKDGRIEVLLASHNTAGGRVFVIENSAPNTWELVYATALIDSSSSSSNARYATAGDLDGDGNWEIMYVAGNGYNTDRNPEFQVGVYVWEHDGVSGSDNYGTWPATVGQYSVAGGDPAPGFARSQNLQALDVDGDGQMELLIPSDGASANDVMYVASVTGTFEPNGAGTGFETWVVEHREAPRQRGLGGGSPYDIIAADMNGDSFMDLSYHTWNNLNFFNVTTNGADTYLAPADGQFYKASPSDHVSLFGGVAGDIDGDGNDEVFYPNFQTGNITVINYNDFDDVREIGAANVFYDAIPIGGAGGSAIGDLDEDGALEVIVGGPGYGQGSRNSGAPSTFIRVAEFNGGDPGDGANYTVTSIDTSAPADTVGFHTVNRDSLGTMSTYYELASSKQGTTTSASDPIFPSGIAYLGDADGDGDIEIALSFQGVDDSLYVYSEVWNADSTRFERSIASRYEAPVRPFMRVISMDGLAVSTEENVIVLPSDYKLSANYPNPFNPSTSFSITLPVDRSVSLRVYDVSGRLVRTIVSGQHHAAGTYEFTWDGTNDAGAQVASGTYLYTLEYGNFRQSRTMVLLK
ncbi:MAG: T9SS type A sorting domain-containing protein [Rhodothermales bacterium]|nr:T9SS type A sorting domain-containing protein [Rhodothermales bacterium]